MRYLTLAALWFVDVFFSFSGRIDRAQLIARTLVLIFGYAVFAIIAVSYFSQPTVSLLFVTVPLCAPLCLISLLVRRLHDHDIDGAEVWEMLYSILSERGEELRSMIFRVGTPETNSFGTRPDGVLAMNAERKRRHLGQC